MCHQRFVQVAEDRPTLQPARLHHGQHPLHEAAPRLAVRAKGILPPQHPAAQHPLCMVVRRLDPVADHEPPHRWQQLQHVPAERRRLAIGAPGPSLEHPLEGTRRTVQPHLQLLPVAAAPTEQVPLREHTLGESLQLLSQRRRRPTAVDQLLEIALEVRPANLPAERRQPGVRVPPGHRDASAVPVCRPALHPTERPFIAPSGHRFCGIGKEGKPRDARPHRFTVTVRVPWLSLTPWSGGAAPRGGWWADRRCPTPSRRTCCQAPREGRWKRWSRPDPVAPEPAAPANGIGSVS